MDIFIMTSPAINSVSSLSVRQNDSNTRRRILLGHHRLDCAGTIRPYAGATAVRLINAIERRAYGRSQQRRDF